MKATRAAVRQAKSLESQDERLTAIEQRLERIEALLNDLCGKPFVTADDLSAVFEKAKPAPLVGELPTQATQKTKAGAK